MRIARYLCVLLAIIPATVCAEVFKWVDEDGKIHYSDNPPPSNSHQDLSDKLTAPPCDKACQDNVQRQEQYRNQYLQERQQSETSRRMELESSNQRTRQEQAAQDAKRRQEELDAKRRSDTERNRIPSNDSRTP